MQRCSISILDDPVFLATLLKGGQGNVEILAGETRIHLTPDPRFIAGDHREHDGKGETAALEHIIREGLCLVGLPTHHRDDGGFCGAGLKAQ